MKKLIMILLLLLTGCSSTSYRSLSMNEGMQAYQKDTNAILLDVRTLAEYQSGHIENAIHINHQDILNDNYQLNVAEDTPIYIYCRSGNRSKQAAQKLTEDGYTNIIEIGGIHDYQGEIVYE